MSKPYYEDELVTLYHGDCLEINEWLSADVLVTDPPYGMALKSSWGGVMGDMKIANDETVAVRDLSVSKWGTERPALVFGRWDIQPPKGAKQCLVWDKGEHVGMGDLNIPWKPNWEAIFVLGVWPKRSEVTRNSSVLKSLAISGTLSGTRGDLSSGRDHPTPKPVGLMEALIGKIPRGIVADPFAGSGTTLLAARNLGRKSIGIELEERYCEIAAKRLRQQAFDLGDIA